MFYIRVVWDLSHVWMCLSPHLCSGKLLQRQRSHFLSLCVPPTITSCNLLFTVALPHSLTIKFKLTTKRKQLTIPKHLLCSSSFANITITQHFTFHRALKLWKAGFKKQGSKLKTSNFWRLCSNSPLPHSQVLPTTRMTSLKINYSMNKSIYL